MAKEAARSEATAVEDPPRTTVYLGNRKTISIQAGERVPYPGKRCTTVVIRPDATLMEAVTEITAAQGLWAAHSDDEAPAWVAAEGPMAEGLVQILSAHYKCEVRDPEPAEG